MHSDYTIHKQADVMPRVCYDQAPTEVGTIAQWLIIQLGQDSVCIQNLPVDDAIGLAIDIIHAVVAFQKVNHHARKH